MKPTSREIFLYSGDASIYVNDSHSDCIFYFSDSIIAFRRWRMVLSVLNFQCPLTYYNVNSSNNYVEYIWDGDGQTYNFSVTQGEYDIDGLVTALNNGFATDSDVTVSVSSTTNKLTFSQGSGYTLTTNSTINTLIGLEESTSYTGNITAPNVYDLAGPKAILIHSNFSTLNLDSRTGKSSHYLQAIPVNESYGSLQSYSSLGNRMVHITDRYINMAHIRLEDEKQNLIDLNGTHWFLTLLVDFEPEEDHYGLIDDSRRESFSQK